MGKVNVSSMGSAPKDGTPIVAYCKHEADSYILDDDGKRLTVYGAHAESLTSVPDRWHVVVWGGSYTEYDEYNNEIFDIPDWWFRSGSDFEEVANPIMWFPICTNGE